MARTYYRFTVTGKIPFPLDMLRYDACYPADGESAIEIGMSIRREPPSNLDVYKVVLSSTIPNHPPTEDRWRSFSWTVTDKRKV